MRDDGIKGKVNINFKSKVNFNVAGSRIKCGMTGKKQKGDKIEKQKGWRGEKFHRMKDKIPSLNEDRL